MKGRVAIMEDRFNNFEEKRAEIFRELIKKAWQGSLQNQDLNNILSHMQEKYGYTNNEISFLRNHIRLLMGLNPRDEEDFIDVIEKAKSFGHLSGPVVNKIQGICQECDQEIENCSCYEVCKYEAQIYRRNTGPEIAENKCYSCGQCVAKCSFGAIADKVEFMPLINLL